MMSSKEEVGIFQQTFDAMIRKEYDYIDDTKTSLCYESEDSIYSRAVQV